MSTKKIRVRFAPAPTGMMHLGNIRTALMNALFAKKQNGTFVLRIEDTDSQRNYDPEATHIIQDLKTLGLVHDEGPQAAEPYGPYFQSKRNHIYKEQLQYLIEKEAVYRCFCTEDELEKKRERQRALKLPPRYDRICLAYSQEDIHTKLAEQSPFIWRLKLNYEQAITIQDLAHKEINFELKHFSDFPLTRKDGSFTFMFANCVDDIAMQITHIFRGEDHLTNTAGQAALYHAFKAPLPLFWHMPILCNTSGKKLSKRDFGFSLRDLLNEGFTPQAIINYLAILGSSYKEEIMSFDELTQTIELDNPHTTGHITYDTEKLRWINRKWIERYSQNELLNACTPYLQKDYPHVSEKEIELLAPALQILKTEMTTLKDCGPLVGFCFKEPDLSSADFLSFMKEDQIPLLTSCVKKMLKTVHNSTECAAQLRESARTQQLPLKIAFRSIRLALTGSINGPSIQELLTILDSQTAQNRLENLLNIFS